MQEFPLIATLAVGFTAAWVLGLFTQWLQLSPIVGYLLAGVLIGPYTPGFIGDKDLAHQLAEVGVILLMFGVGLHFHLDDLLAVRAVAIPGAIGQSVAATVISMALFLPFGMDPKTGAVLGMAMAVASTVVLMRVLMDADALHSPAGHVALGWLLVEDVLTVIILVLIPVLSQGDDPATKASPANTVAEAQTFENAGQIEETTSEPGFWSSPVAAVGLALLKLAALVGIMMVVGGRVIPWALTQVARLRSRELFTLTVMVFSVAIAAGAFALFGASMALGAFLAGMVVAQSPVSHQAAADALPLRDAFAVLFFVSVGMLFDPAFLLREPLMMLAAMAVILLVKPVAALLIVAFLGYSARTSLTVALGLAQIGEFSFILSNVAQKHGLMPKEGHNLLVAGAILSITLNPMLFRSLGTIERWLRKSPRFWSFLNARAERKAGQMNAVAADQIAHSDFDGSRLAVVVGFGPVGRTVDRLLREAGIATVIVDMNMDTVAELTRQDRTAIFGDASREAILESAGVGRATHLVLTMPQATDRAAIVALARNLNSDLKIFVRARYFREQEELDHVGATATIFEEGEAAVALARLVLADTGAGRDSIERAVRDIRTRLILENVSTLETQPICTCMVPWKKVRCLQSTASLEDVRRQVGEQLYSRWPVMESKTGKPLGFLLVKDLIGLNSEGSAWTSLIQPLGSVGPQDDVQSVLERFHREGAAMFLVMDHGHALGLVTIEDILDQVMGRIQREQAGQPRTSLQDMILTDDSLLTLSSETAEEAIAEMAARIPKDRVPPGANIAELAIARERGMPTSVGFGVALPHARCPKLASPIVVFGRSFQGILFDPRSQERVHLIFLLITPTEEPDLQVLLLSQIAQVIGDPENRRRLGAALTGSEVHDILATDPAK